jgi:gas vesicle protein
MMEDEKLQLLIGLFGELKTEINAGQEELKKDLNDVKTELKNDIENSISAVKDEVSAVKNE